MTGLVCGALAVTIDACKFAEAADSFKANKQDNFRKTTFLLRGLNLGFSVLDIAGRIAGASTTHMVALSSFECLSRVLTALNSLGEMKERRGFTENCASLLPFIDIIKVAFKHTAYVNEDYLNNAIRPIYRTVEDCSYRNHGGGCGESLELVGHKVIDPRECEATIAQAKAIATVLSYVGATANLSLWVKERFNPTAHIASNR